MSVFKNRHGELRSGWTLLIGCVFLHGASMFIGNLASPFIESLPYMIIMLILYLIEAFCLVAGSILLFWMLFRRKSSDMGFTKSGQLSQLGIGLLYGAGAIVSVFLILLLSGQMEIVAVNPSALLSGDFWIWFVVFAVMAAAEEAIYRSFMMSAAKTSRSKLLIFLMPQLFFSYAHLGNDSVTFLALANIALVGVWFAIIFWRSGSFWVAYGTHFAWNFFQGNILGMNVSGFETASLISSRFTGADLLTGGAFGSEGGIIATLVLVLASALAFFVLRKPAPDGWTIDGGLPSVDSPASASLSNKLKK